jgi:hypothetical protein
VAAVTNFLTCQEARVKPARPVMLGSAPEVELAVPEATAEPAALATVVFSMVVAALAG